MSRELSSNKRRAKRARLSAVWPILVSTLMSIACSPSVAAALHQADRNYSRLDRVAQMIREGQLAHAEAELEDVIRIQPHDANALNLLGVVRAQQRREAEAEQLFLKAIKESPGL